MQKPQDTPFDEDLVRAAALALKDLDGPLLPILHALQDRFGFIDSRALPIIAEVLNLSRAELQGVVGFYHDFRAAPAGRHVIKICRAEACQAMGCETLVAALEARFGIKMGETTPDRRVTLETVYCLGNCALSPAALVNGTLRGRLTADRAAALVDEGAR